MRDLPSAVYLLLVFSVLLAGCKGDQPARPFATTVAGETNTAADENLPELGGIGDVFDRDRPSHAKESGRPPVPANALSTRMIFGGLPVPAGQLMNVVGLTRPGEWVPACTGTLIEPDIVLAAAHCYCTDSPTNGDVYVGGNANQEGGRYYGIKRIRLIKQCPFNAGKDLDLAVVKLVGPVKQALPMGFATDTEIEKTSSFRVAGFGAIDQTALVYPGQKRHARTPKVSSACMGQADGKPEQSKFGCKPGYEIVAGIPGFPDSCNGDSGGPLLITSAGNAGSSAADTFLLAGVTSRSVLNSTEPCGQGGVYVRLTSDVRKSIAEAINKLKTQ